MLIEQSYALMAPTGVGGAPTDVLVSDDDRFEARAHALVSEGKMTMLGIGVNHDLGASYFVFDHLGRLVATATSDLLHRAEELAAANLKVRGMAITHRQPLLADRVSGSRRTSVLKWGDELSLRVKRLDGEDGSSWLQVRAYLSTAGARYFHSLLTSDGRLVCLVTGRTDQDAWLRLQGELSREGLEVS